MMGKGGKSGCFSRLAGVFGSPRCLLVAALAVLLVPNVALCFTERLHWLVCVCNIMLPIAFYLFALSSSRNIGVNVWLLFPFVFLSAFQLVLLYLYKGGIISIDMFLNVVTTNPGEVFELLDNIAAGVAVVLLLYIPLLVWAVFLICRKARIDARLPKKARRVALAVLLSAIPFVAASYAFVPSFSFKYHIFPANVCYNLYLSAERLSLTAGYQDTSRGFRYNAASSHGGRWGEKEVYVLVIGETARADNWALCGYGRDTNPLLSKTGGLVVFPKAFSQSNTTHKSVPMLLSSVSAANYNDIYSQKSIITAFKEAGFRTAFYSNQRRNRSFIDIFGSEADTCVFLKDEKKADERGYSDMALLEHAEREIARNSGRLFIILHAYGSHFKYNERYAPADSYFKPDDKLNIAPENRPYLINAYDNTIRLADRLLYGVICALKSGAECSAMMYTSDHGEDIFDISRSAFLHSSPTPSYYQLHVPLLVWLSPGYIRLRPEACEALAANRSKPVVTSVSVFHTMLDIGGVSTRMNDPRRSLASWRYTPGRFYVIDDYNLPRKIGEIKFSAKDMELFRKAQIE